MSHTRSNLPLATLEVDHTARKNKLMATAHPSTDARNRNARFPFDVSQTLLLESTASRGLFELVGDGRLVDPGPILVILDTMCTSFVQRYVIFLSGLGVSLQFEVAVKRGKGII